MSRGQKRHARRRANQLTKDRLEDNKIKISKAKAKRDEAESRYANARHNHDKTYEQFKYAGDKSITRADVALARSELKAAKSQWRASKGEYKQAKNNLSMDTKDIYSKAYGDSVRYYKSPEGKALSRMETAQTQAKVARSVLRGTAAAGAIAGGIGLMYATGSPIGIAPTGAAAYAVDQTLGQRAENAIMRRAYKKIQADGSVK